jgi:Flp pilus assembly pilin Flp
MNIARLVRDQSGAVLVEVTLMMSIMFVFILGSIEFLFVFYQWNAAAKAVQVGLRIASTSNPVSAGLNALSNSVLGTLAQPGDPMPNFSVTCDGASASCTCGGSGPCPAGGAYDAEAMKTIVFGRGSSSCSDATSSYDAGMCDIFPRITPSNIVIVYSQSGLGFAGRPGGPVPTITMSLQHLPVQFFFLSRLMGFADLQIPALTSSITGEDLSSTAPTF